MKSVNPEATLDYVPDCDRALDPKDQTVFELTNLTEEEQAFLKDLAGAPGSQINYALHLGLAGAKNFSTANGQEIEWKRDNSKKAIIGRKKPWLNVLSYIPHTVRDELAARIFRGVDLEEDERKNS